METVRSSGHRGARRLLHLPRLRLEPGRTRTLAEPALLRRGRPVRLRLPGRYMPLRQLVPRERKCSELRVKIRVHPTEPSALHRAAKSQYLHWHLALPELELQAGDGAAV